MATTVVNQDLLVRGTLGCKRFNPPAGCIDNDALDPEAELEQTKLQHRHALRYSKNGTIAAATEYLHVMKEDGVVLAIEAAVTETVATGTDRVASVDLQKSTGGGAFATILTATIDFDDDSDLRVVVAGDIDTADVVAGDILRIVITVAGSDGNQALGLAVTVTVRENGQQPA